MTNATRYINQFTEIFTEEGRKNVKITHKVPNQAPRVSFTPGLRATMSQQQQQHLQQQLAQQQQGAGGTSSQASAANQKKPQLVTAQPQLQVSVKQLFVVTSLVLNMKVEKHRKWCIYWLVSRLTFPALSGQLQCKGCARSLGGRCWGRGRDNHRVRGSAGTSGAANTATGLVSSSTVDDD